MAKAFRAPRRARPFSPWRIVVWIVMFLAAAGFVINAFGVYAAASSIGAFSAEALAAGAPDPRVFLAWSLVSTLGAFIVMVLALATLRWTEWGRRYMRIAAGALAVWAICTAVLAYQQWQQLGVDLAQPGIPIEVVAHHVKLRSILLVGIVLKAMSVPVLAWLSWVLGSAPVRRQFAQPAL